MCGGALSSVLGEGLLPSRWGSPGPDGDVDRSRAVELPKQRKICRVISVDVRRRRVEGMGGGNGVSKSRQGAVLPAFDCCLRPFADTDKLVTDIVVVVLYYCVK